ncbi:peroxiredoxin-like family protein [Sinorhizobium sp. 7-81]|uniref:peroxiredoxin-like family protein n=1 Tax=Sinorhizobium sp. 8-89 TaxID=3049089 RepID=UPI0024C31067|nr:peroxiredoxin-like family protein [Sinorhizobium sp. 8-89]MDK1489733.1 peroxiredoxin-like family protein [Sinorhizobium sp. 8-89]
MLVPRMPAPGLTVRTLDHGTFDLASEAPSLMTLVCFYRGLHCPLCATYLKELERLTPSFAERGVSTIAISSDGEERARQMANKIGAEHLRVGYGLPLGVARRWGLYVSTSRGKTSLGLEEPELFSEPGIFLVKPDQTVYWLSVQSMPFARPNFAEMVQALDFVIKNDYPARGEYTGEV